MSSLAPYAKRLKTNNDSVGPDQLRSWVSNAKKKNSSFSPQMREDLLKSQNVNAIHILQFVLEFVFGWSPVEIISEYEEDYFREDGTLVHRTIRDVYKESLNRDDRGTALAFVTEWLGQDPEVESSNPDLPSLARLCAQRIAIDMFDTFMYDLDINFEDKNLDYFKDTLKGDIESQLKSSSVPDYLHTSIIEEIVIFIIVHFLFIDLRSLVLCPAHPERVLKLPVFVDEEYVDWQSEVIDSVRDTGRGSLAKVGLLTFSVLKSYKKKLSDTELYGSKKSYGHIEVLTTGLFGERRHGEFNSRHPFACTVVKAPLAAIVHACLRGNDYNDPEYREQLVWNNLIPWIKQQGITETRKCGYDLLLLASKNVSLTEMRHPGPFMMDQAGCNAIVRDCIDAFAAQNLYESAIIFTGGYDGDRGGYCRRLRLNGNFSKEEILSAVLVGKDATLIDLEYCKQLDEECLEAILFHTRSLKRMMLKGTQIGKHSNVIKNANVGRKQKIHFIFEDACKVSGRPSVLTQCNFIRICFLI